MSEDKLFFCRQCGYKFQGYIYDDLTYIEYISCDVCGFETIVKPKLDRTVPNLYCYPWKTKKNGALMFYTTTREGLGSYKIGNKYRKITKPLSRQDVEAIVDLFLEKEVLDPVADYFALWNKRNNQLDFVFGYPCLLELGKYDYDEEELQAKFKECKGQRYKLE